MKTVTFTTSYLTFYLKGEIKTEGNFLKFKVPNTVLGFIPLGAYKKTVAINQISSVSDEFKLVFKNFLIGIIFAIIGLCLFSSVFILGLLFLAIGVLGALNAFQTVMAVTLTSGEVLFVPFIIFEKAKAQEAVEEIQNLVSERLDDTNARKQAEKSMEHRHKETDRMIKALKNKK